MTLGVQLCIHGDERDVTHRAGLSAAAETY